MKVFVGLGNPGEKYARQRHNIGFMALDAIARAHGFSPWRPRFQSLAAEGMIGNDKILALKPQTYMNESGRAVGEALRFFKLVPGDVVVLHDELELDPGRVKVKTGGGHAGHNGLRSIDAHIGPAYRRLRLGIGHPGVKDLVLPWVLGDFARADLIWLEPLLNAVADAAPLLISGDDSAFPTRVALLTQPPKPAKPPKAPAPLKAEAMAPPRTPSED
jgi:PTH1 family peptidyl-tRNA hydrolase